MFSLEPSEVSAAVSGLVEAGQEWCAHSLTDRMEQVPAQGVFEELRRWGGNCHCQVWHSGISLSVWGTEKPEAFVYLFI